MSWCSVQVPILSVSLTHTHTSKLTSTPVRLVFKWIRARILVYKYLYRNARCLRTTHLLLLLMPAVGIYTASAICCHCRCGSCITTYFNIMFFLLLAAIFDCWMCICSPFSTSFFAILPSFCLLFNKFIFPFVIILFHLIQCRFSIFFCCTFFVAQFFFFKFSFLLYASNK